MNNVNDISTLKIYESELWSGIDIIKDNEVIYKNILNSLIYTYSSIESIELNYSEELNHLSDLLYIPQVQSTFISALNANKIFIKEKADRHKAFSDSLHKITEELKESIKRYLPSIVGGKATKMINNNEGKQLNESKTILTGADNRKSVSKINETIDSDLQAEIDAIASSAKF